MSYELDRMQKQRRALFEEEMARRIAYLDAVVEMNNWSYYFMHLHHTRQTKPQHSVLSHSQYNVSHRSSRDDDSVKQVDKTAEISAHGLEAKHE